MVKCSLSAMLASAQVAIYHLGLQSSPVRVQELIQGQMQEEIGEWTQQEEKKALMELHVCNASGLESLVPFKVLL